MTKTQIQQRLDAIDHRMDSLNEEKHELLVTQAMYDKWSPEAIKKKVIALVHKHYGQHHNIKLAMFKANSEYNDEGYNYNPCLILIDNTFTEVPQNINLRGMAPNDDDQHEYYDVVGDDLHIEDVTVKF